MALSLFAHPFSSYCQKALVALYENGTPFTYRLLDQRDPDTFAEFAVLWPLHTRIEHEDPAAVRAATARFARELKRLLLHGVLRPERCPELVASLTSRRGAAPPERKS